MCELINIENNLCNKNLSPFSLDDGFFSSVYFSIPYDYKFCLFEKKIKSNKGHPPSMWLCLSYNTPIFFNRPKEDRYYEYERKDIYFNVFSLEEGYKTGKAFIDSVDGLRLRQLYKIAADCNSDRNLFEMRYPIPKWYN